ncbi:MAG: hypothetical protein HOI23_10230 [Deltaproteobacteria bacterium]|nr:hypothetical protein [Deltaproteobacteria bacterium]
MRASLPSGGSGERWESRIQAGSGATGRSLAAVLAPKASQQPIDSAVLRRPPEAR